METIQVADLKAKFSEVLKKVHDEHKEYVIQYGRKHEKVAVLVPYEIYQKKKSGIKLGLLEKSGSYKIHDDFEMTEEELVG